MKARKVIKPKTEIKKIKGFDDRGDGMFTLEIDFPGAFDDILGGPNTLTFIATDFPDHPFCETVIDEIVDSVNKMNCIKECLRK